MHIHSTWFLNFYVEFLWEQLLWRENYEFTHRLKQFRLLWRTIDSRKYTSVILYVSRDITAYSFLVNCCRAWSYYICIAVRASIMRRKYSSWENFVISFRWLALIEFCWGWVNSIVSVTWFVPVVASVSWKSNGGTSDPSVVECARWFAGGLGSWFTFWFKDVCEVNGSPGLRPWLGPWWGGGIAGTSSRVVRQPRPGLLPRSGRISFFVGVARCGRKLSPLSAAIHLQCR